MAETVTVDGAEVEVRSVPGGFEVEEVESFEDYLKREVFTSGTYTYEESSETCVDVGVAEYEDGGGYTIGTCIENAVNDDNVGVEAIREGWLLLRDER